MDRTPGTLMPDRFQETDRGESEIMEIQMGPSHPASHGTVKFNLRLDGETIVPRRIRSVFAAIPVSQGIAAYHGLSR